ncbi:MAG: hypothetical protein EAZ97_07650 [Bacteroidetes bacterium]|nr:MAG: hypothetical protein EAZ97_07650 [Bacteroidota bacterium]
MKKLIILFLCLCANQIFAQESYEKGKKSLTDKKYTEAITFFDQTLKENPDNFMALYQRGMANLENKNAQKAIEDFDKAIAMNPMMAEVYAWRGQAQQSVGNKDLAVADYTSAIEIDKTQGDYFYKRGLLQAELKNNLEAVKDLQEAGKLSPQLADANSKRKEFMKKITSTDDLAFLAPAADKNNKPVPDDANTIAAKKYLEEHKFASLNEGRDYYYALNSKTGFATGKKTMLYALIRKKTLKDIYGENPYKEQIDAMKSTVDRESWLRPDGTQYYFDLIKNSKYFFSDGVQRKDTYYYYKAIKNQRSEDYDLQMFAVKNKETKMVFNSKIRLTEDSTGRKVSVMFAESKGYLWKVSDTDYLEATVAADNLQQVTFTPYGMIAAKKDSNHGLPPSKYNDFVKPKTATESALMKAAVNTLILDYPSSFLGF